MTKEELKDIRSFLKEHKHAGLNWSKQCLADQMLRGHQVVVRWEDGTTDIPEICAKKIREYYSDCAFTLISKPVRQKLTPDNFDKVAKFISNL